MWSIKKEDGGRELERNTTEESDLRVDDFRRIEKDGLVKEVLC